MPEGSLATRRRSPLLLAISPAVTWLRRCGWRPLTLFIASRLVAMTAVAFTIATGQGFVADRFGGPWPRLPAGPLLIQALGAWDGAWYTYIAGHGYETSLAPLGPHTASVSFFPLFPLVIRVVASTGLGVLLAGALTTFILGAAASVALWLLAAELCDEHIADRAVALWSFWPGAFVLSMIYSEGLTVLLVSVCLLALTRKWWLLAGLAAGLATASAPEAVVLVGCCAWVALPAIRKGQWRATFAIALAPLGMLAYFLYLYARTGDFLFWFRVEHATFQNKSDLGTAFYDTTVGNLRSLVTHPHVLLNTEPALGLILAVVLLGLLISWRPPFVFVIWTVGVIVLALAAAPVGMRPRFFLVAFPLIIGLARAAKGVLHDAILGFSAVLMGVLFVITLTAVLNYVFP